MKTLFKILGGLVLLLVLAVGGLIAAGTMRLEAKIELPHHGAPTASTDPASIAEGARLARVFVCAECHGEGLEGTNFLEGGPFMMLPAPNLTGGRFTDEELERAIRHGLGADGRSLVIMPVDVFAGMSDEDLSQMLGYIQSLPLVETELIERSVGPIGRAVGAFQAAKLQPSRSIEQTVEHASTALNVGEYYAATCQGCHGADLGGQMVEFGPQPIWSPNLTQHASGLAAWSEGDFATAVRQGRTPRGDELNATAMPWKAFQWMHDEELTQLWNHVRALPPVDRSAPVAE